MIGDMLLPCIYRVYLLVNHSSKQPLILEAVDCVLSGNCLRGDTRFRGGQSPCVVVPTWTQRHSGEAWEIRGLDRHEETTLNKAIMGGF